MSGEINHRSSRRVREGPRNHYNRPYLRCEAEIDEPDLTGAGASQIQAVRIGHIDYFGDSFAHLRRCLCLPFA
jgi:hypothetical protein